MLSIERIAWRPKGTTTPKVKEGANTEGSVRTFSLTDDVLNEVKLHIKWMETYLKCTLKGH